MADAREVEFYDISATRSVIHEIAADLTVVQQARFQKAVARLEKHGWALNGDFFSRVAGCDEKLWEYRLTLDKVDYRLLFCEEPGNVFVVLVGYKEKRNDVSKADIDKAERRISEWRRRRADTQAQMTSRPRK